MDKVQLFSIVNEIYYECKKSKKYSEDTFNFEKNEISNIIKLVNLLNSKTFKADNNYTFITLKPRPREIFATSLDTRICHYILEKNLRPIMEQELSDRTFNNRKGKGSTGAIKLVMKDISEVKNCLIIKLDFKGYFPNANLKIAYREMKELLDKSECKNKDFLDWLLKVTMFSLPQKHCYKKSDDKMWNKIPPEKSLFNKEDYYGGAIGFLIWQMAMGVYPNKVIKWIRNKGIRVTVFVDDLIFVTADKNRVLNLIPEIRKLLKKFKIQLNENKFYCLHISKGFEFLGNHIKYNRIYLNNKTIKRMFLKINKLNNIDNKYFSIDKFLSIINCYLGMLKTRNNFGILCKVLNVIDNEWLKWFIFNEEKKCFQFKNGYSKRNRLIRKYKINLKK